LLKTLLVLAILIALTVGFFVYVPYGPATETFVDILPGTGTLGIARQLQKAGIVRSAWAFDTLVIWKTVSGHRAGSLKAGEYRFDHAAGMEEVYDRLRRGDRGREHDTCVPDSMRRAAAATSAGPTRFRVPRWSSSPQRPQLDSDSK